MTNVDIAKKYVKDKVFKINDKIFGEYNLFMGALSGYSNISGKFNIFLGVKILG